MGTTFYFQEKERKTQIEGEEMARFLPNGGKREAKRSIQSPEEKGGEGILDLDDFRL